jgi:hypothetical protein
VAAHRTGHRKQRTVNPLMASTRYNFLYIFLKLQVADRAQAIVRARQAGFGQSIPGSDRPSPPIGQA